jgi:hypothetical protein
MKLTEKDLIFFIGSIIGIIGYPVLWAIFIYAHFYRNPNQMPFWKPAILMLFFTICLIPCINHARDCIRKLK